MSRRRIVIAPLRGMTESEIERLVVQLNREFEFLVDELEKVRTLATPAAVPRARIKAPDRTAFDFQERLRAIEHEVFEGTRLGRGGFYRGEGASSGGGGGGEGEPPEGEDPDPPTLPPPIPTNVRASGGDGLVLITWNASPTATSYNVRRSTTSGGPYVLVASGLTSTSYTDTTVTNGTTYYYVVIAKNSIGGSGKSLEASATPQAGVPGVGFTLIHTIPDTSRISNPMDFWAQENGSGFDGKLFLSMGGRKTGGRNGAAIFSFDGASWTKEFESGHETANKLRSVGGTHLFAWLERADQVGGTSTLVRRAAGSAAWAYESVPFDGNTVGGRGLGINGSTVVVGQSENWGDGDDARIYTGSAGGAYGLSASDGGRLIWEIEFDSLGRRWDFYVHWSGRAGVLTRLNGASIPSPGDGARAVAWHPGQSHMYACAGLQTPTGKVMRSNGGAWGEVFDANGEADNIRYVPRGSGELWLTTFDPFNIYRSTDGVTWTLMHSETFDTERDTNQLTAIGYYNGKVYAATRNADANATYIYRET